MQQAENDYEIWQKNGMAPFLEEWSKYSSVRTAEQNREFILNAAKLARTLRLEDLFAEELKDIRYSDGFMTLKKFLADEKDPALLKLNAKFCSDFMLENPTTEPLDNVRLGILAKFGAFTAKGIINRDNYPEAARQYMNTFRAFERGILENDKISNYDKQRLADKVFAPEMSCVDGRYELKNKADYLKKLKLMETAATELPDFDKLMFICEGINASLWMDKQISDDYVTGLVQNIIPDIKEGKENTTEDNLWGMYAFEYGIGNFKYKALTTRVTPSNLAALIRAYKETPSTDFEKFNQNRLDGLSLQNISKATFSGENRGFESLRDTIHDQRPQTAELIKKMTAYYDAVKSGNGVEKAKAEMLDANAKNIGYRLGSEYLCNIANYEQKTLIEGTKDQYEPVIDILRRLEKNMGGDDKAPQTSDEKLNLLARGLEENPYDKKRLGILLKRINDTLLREMDNKTIGIKPETVSFIVWADKKCAGVLNDMDYEYQFGAQDTEWFKQAVKFSMLINDSGEQFDRQKFESLTADDTMLSIEERYGRLAEEQKRYLINAQNACIRDGIRHLKEINPGLKDVDAAKMLSKKAAECGETETIEKFNRGEKLSAAERREILIIFQYHNRLESIGSGNTLKALQNLTFWHQASTRAGEKHRKSRIAEQPRTDGLKQAILRSGIDISYKNGRD